MDSLTPAQKDMLERFCEHLIEAAKALVELVKDL